MPKDSYKLILAELRKVVKQVAGLRKRTMTLRTQMGSARDNVQIGKIRKQLGLK